MKRVLVAMTAVAMVLSACASSASPEPSSGSGSGRNPSGETRLVVSVFPAPVTDAFSSTYCRGMKVAAEDFADYGIEIDCQGVLDATDQKYVAALEAAIARNPAVLVVISNSPKEAVKPTIQQALDQGIKVIAALGVGQLPGDTADIGALVYIGTAYYNEGRAMGNALAAAGVTNVLCRNPLPGVYPFDARCQGTEDSLKEADSSIKFKQVPMPYNDAVQSTNALTAALAADPTVDGLSNCESSQYTHCIDPLKELGLWGTVKVAYVDINAQEAQDIKDGNAVFATTQQGFLEGYLVVMTAALNLEYGILPGGLDRQVFTGPLNIDRDNVDDLIPFLESGNF